MSNKCPLILLIVFFPIYIFCQQNVGIGTESPQAKLHINEANNPFKNPFRVDFGSTPKLVVGTNGGTSLGAGFGATTNGLYVVGNVGVGVQNATDKLSVDGDVNIAGEIKANGAQGSPGQFLTPTTSGEMEWTNGHSLFKNIQGFGYSEAQQFWTVPEGVTDIEIEIWGGGQGGGNIQGGQGGGYMSLRFEATPFSLIIINVGKGGDGRISNVQPDIPEEAGENTVVNGTGFNVTAFGGDQGSSVGGTFKVNSLTVQGAYWGALGTNGNGFSVDIQQLTPELLAIWSDGSGGMSHPFRGESAKGGEYYQGYDPFYPSKPGTNARNYGWGGGAAIQSVSGDGADGYVKIRW